MIEGWHQSPEQPIGMHAQSPRCRIAQIAELLDRLIHPLPDIGPDNMGRIEHPRHGCHRHLRALGHIDKARRFAERFGFHGGLIF